MVCNDVGKLQYCDCPLPEPPSAPGTDNADAPRGASAPLAAPAAVLALPGLRADGLAAVLVAVTGLGEAGCCASELPNSKLSKHALSRQLHTELAMSLVICNADCTAASYCYLTAREVQLPRDLREGAAAVASRPREVLARWREAVCSFCPLARG